MGDGIRRVAAGCLLREGLGLNGVAAEDHCRPYGWRNPIAADTCLRPHGGVVPEAADGHLGAAGGGRLEPADADLRPDGWPVRVVGQSLRLTRWWEEHAAVSAYHGGCLGTPDDASGRTVLSRAGARSDVRNQDAACGEQGKKRYPHIPPLSRLGAVAKELIQIGQSAVNCDEEGANNVPGSQAARGLAGSVEQRGLERGSPRVGFRVIGTKPRAEFPVRPAEASLFGFPDQEARPARPRFHVGLLVSAELAQEHRAVLRLGPGRCLVERLAERGL